MHMQMQTSTAQPMQTSMLLLLLRANKETSVDVFSNFSFIIATGLGFSSTSKQTKQASKPTKNQTNTPRFLLKLFLHSCDWSGTQLHKQAKETSKPGNKQTRVDAFSNFFFIIATGACGIESQPSSNYEEKV